MSQTSKACHLHTLASSPVAQVQRCQGCGCISIHLGPTTVRMQPEAFLEFCKTMSEASRQVDPLRTLSWYLREPSLAS